MNGPPYGDRILSIDRHSKQATEHTSLPALYVEDMAIGPAHEESPSHTLLVCMYEAVADCSGNAQRVHIRANYSSDLDKLPYLLRLSADGRNTLQRIDFELHCLGEEDAAQVAVLYGGEPKLLHTPRGVAVGPDGAAYVAMLAADEMDEWGVRLFGCSG